MSLPHFVLHLTSSHSHHPISTHLTSFPVIVSIPIPFKQSFTPFYFLSLCLLRLQPVFYPFSPSFILSLHLLSLIHLLPLQCILYPCKLSSILSLHFLFLHSICYGLPPCLLNFHSIFIPSYSLSFIRTHLLQPKFPLPSHFNLLCTPSFYFLHL